MFAPEPRQRFEITIQAGGRKFKHVCVLSHFRAAPSGQVIIEDLAADLDNVETNYASIKALRKAAT
jgi:hypothetical protein